MEPRTVSNATPATATINPAAPPAAQKNDAKVSQSKQLTLPVSVVSKVDVGRLVREVNAVNEFLHQAEIRQPGTPMQLPKSSRLMDEVVQYNKLNLLQTDDRAILTSFLMATKSTAPTLHMSFSADPSPHFLNKLIKRIRETIHPNVLLSVGLQPTIGAGCVIRTTNKYFDLSLRHNLTTKSAVLMRTLRAAIAQEPATAVASADVPAVEALSTPLPPSTPPATQKKVSV